MVARDRTTDEQAQADAWLDLTWRAQRTARSFLALEAAERALLVGPHLPRYPDPVARVMRQLDALDDAEWQAMGRYIRIVYGSIEGDR